MDYNVANIKNMSKLSGVNKMENEITFQEQLDEMVEKVTDRVDRYMPDYGEFSPIMEFTPNKDNTLNVGKYGLKVYKMPKDVVEDPKQRFIEAAEYMPAGDYKADMIVGSGHKEKILEILKDPEFVQKLNEVYGELIYTLENS